MKARITRKGYKENNSIFTVDASNVICVWDISGNSLKFYFNEGTKILTILSKDY